MDKCRPKHFKCVVGGDRHGKRCVANILVCDGTNDCMDGSDEDPNLCSEYHTGQYNALYVAGTCELLCRRFREYCKLS